MAHSDHTTFKVGFRKGPAKCQTEAIQLLGTGEDSGGFGSWRESEFLGDQVSIWKDGRFWEWLVVIVLTHCV